MSEDGGYLIPVGDDDLLTAMKAKMEQGGNMSENNLAAKLDKTSNALITTGCAITLFVTIPAIICVLVLMLS